MIDCTGFVFTPKDDITIHELAQILASILEQQGSLFLVEFMDSFPESCVRHFTEKTVMSEASFLKTTL